MTRDQIEATLRGDPSPARTAEPSDVARVARTRTRPPPVAVPADRGPFDRICRTAATATGMAAAVLAVSRDQELAVVGRSTPDAGRGAGLPDGLPATCIEAASRTRRPVVVHDAAPPVSTCVALPLPSAEESASGDRGVLCVYAERPRALSPGELDLLSDLATIAGRLVDQSRRATLLETRNRHLQLGMTSSPNRPWIADRNGQIVALSARLARLTGSLVGRSVDQTLATIVHPDEREATLADWASASRVGRVFDREVRCRGIKGGNGWYRLYAWPHRNEAGEVDAWYGTSQNVTRLRRDRIRLENLAFRDGLTGLLNRAALSVELDRRVGADPASFALLAIDLDDFKAANDMLGYPAGNTILRRIADCLVSCVRQTDMLARVGADEFVILLDETTEPGVAVRCADRIINALRIPVRVEGHAVPINASIGITLSPRDGTSPDELLRNADLALSRAKGEGGGTWRLFEPGMDEVLRAAQALKVELREALRDSQFALEFQPVVDVRNGRIEAFEALIRWHHPVRGIVSPLDFVPLAEQTGLIVPIGRWVLVEACRAAATWPRDIRIAVNVSAIQIRHRDLRTAVEVALASSGLDPERLELEITESILLQDDVESLDTVRQLRKRGIRIAVDDFGTGHATPRALNAFPFDKLKIDRAYVTGDGTPWSLAIVRAAIAMARALDLEIVAEGVERESERDRLRAEGCHLFQGFLFGRPMPFDEVAAHIEGTRR